MRPAVLARQREAMARAGLDALIAISPENFASYTTGFVVPTQPLMRWRHAAAVVTRAGQTAVLSVDMEATTVKHRLPGVDVRVWGEFADRPMAVLAPLLADLGVAEGTIGREMDYLPAGDHAHLVELLPRARFRPAERLYDRLRQLKTPEEIDLLRRLSRIADKSIAEAFASVQAGQTEMDLAAALTRGIYARGAEWFKLMEASRVVRPTPTSNESAMLSCIRHHGDRIRVGRTEGGVESETPRRVLPGGDRRVRRPAGEDLRRRGSCSRRAARDHHRTRDSAAVAPRRIYPARDDDTNHQRAKGDQA
jgi:hypothetical protein